MSKLLYFTVASLFVAFCYRYFVADKSNADRRSILSDWEDILPAENKDRFNKTLKKVTDGVHVAMYYGLANVVMIEGDDGIIIVDTTETPSAIEEAMKEFRKITDKPLKAIILTHFHPDHIRGLDWLLNDTGHPVDVYAHRESAVEVSKSLITSQAAFPRLVRQFGLGLKRREVSSIVTPMTKLNENPSFVVLHPTHIVDDVLEATISGVRIKLIHIPGETSDQISVWLPDKKVLLPADIIYMAFPNIAPVRGDFPRSSVNWFTSIDKIRYLRPEFLVPAHMPHLSGKDKVFEFLTTYRDGIQFVHDQTVRLTNEGLHVSDIVRKVKLPPSLVDLPHLRGFYGTVEWTVRAVYANYTGWFSGEVEELNPLTIKEKAAKMKELLEEDMKTSTGGVDAMIQVAERNLKKSTDHFRESGQVLFVESQWALELASSALVASAEGNSEHERAKEAKINALGMMARYSESITAKNYYLSCAAELDGSFTPFELGNARKVTINKMEITDLLTLFTRRVNPEKCDSYKKITAILYFTDLNKTYGFLLRNCVIEYIDDNAHLPEMYDVKLTMTSQVWRDLSSKERGGMSAYMSGDMVVDGSMMSFKAITDTMN